VKGPLPLRRATFRAHRLANGGRAAAGAVGRRLRHGPTRPDWTWGEEVFAAVARATLGLTGRHLHLMATPGHGFAPPLSRACRAGLSVDQVDLGGIPAERYRPKGHVDGTILRFHGGGYVAGSARLERRPAAEVALLTNCDTYGITYRLAPAHPYPAALEDAVTSYTALVDGGADPQRTVMFGGSAGAGLALSTLLEARRLGLPMPAGAVLLWPYADLTFSGETMRTNAAVDMLPAKELVEVWDPAYVGEADPADPLISPALADLHGLPPLLIVAGGGECLLSCAEQIAANAYAAGVPSRLSVYADKVHGWMILPRLAATIAARDEIVGWIRERVDEAHGPATDDPHTESSDGRPRPG
jgi:salicylate hydroxylase